MQARTATRGRSPRVPGRRGYVEESDLPRLFRQSPLNGVWEGSGNVICLDVLRAIVREPASLDAYWEEVSLAAGADRRLDESIAMLRKECDDQNQIESRARRLVEHLALVFQGALLVRNAPAAIADAFCASRLAGDTNHAFGTMPPGSDMQSIIDRVRPTTP